MNGEKSLFFYIGLFPDFVNHDQGTGAGSYVRLIKAIPKAIR
jgi:hypothetical protein